MGKGFNNYMCKKFFHPASRDNLKRVWMAEQQADAYKKKQEELRVQYEKEQDLHNNKALLSKESKDKLSVNFMYEPPPGAKKEREKEDNEPEYKFEWQRKYNAPRESYCKGDSEIRDQPFGIQVRNVRCIKCHKWGHINTDKECPLYSQAMSVVMASNNNNNTQASSAPDAMTLVQQMREDGLALKKSALDAQQHLRVTEHDHLMVSEDEEQSEMQFIKSLTKKEKKKLLLKLQLLERKVRKKEKRKLKKKKMRSKKRSSSVTSSKSSSNSSSSSSSSSSSDSSSSSSNSDSEDSYSKNRRKQKKLNSKEQRAHKIHKQKQSNSAQKYRHKETEFKQDWHDKGKHHHDRKRKLKDQDHGEEDRNNSHRKGKRKHAHY
ncbi:corepressor interacting with RBPJ 1 [Pseudomyrmex gracilis]|uniref:corepressor interacting with RBPJ 1 n=1 Tax=Pseudomyrmex gracilis TaxID=219809 RepID=UPI00099586AD|nr:corepressor interacting with RBPJ 1 [Pseudomyrmex gracilis]